MRHSESDKADALHRLEESAAGNDGVPVWAAVARDTGYTRKTLQRWWTQRGDRPDNLVMLKREPEQDRASLGEAEAITLPPEDFHAWHFVQIASDIGRARDMNSMGALGGLHKLLRESYADARSAIEKSGKARKLSPAEVEERVRQYARDLPPRLGIAIREELAKRGLA